MSTDTFAETTSTATSRIPGLGWLGLYVVTIAQTLLMTSKLIRRQRGYRV